MRGADLSCVELGENSASTGRAGRALGSDDGDSLGIDDVRSGLPPGELAKSPPRGLSVSVTVILTVPMPTFGRCLNASTKGRPRSAARRVVRTAVACATQCGLPSQAARSDGGVERCRAPVRFFGHRFRAAPGDRAHLGDPDVDAEALAAVVAGDACGHTDVAGPGRGAGGATRQGAVALAAAPHSGVEAALAAVAQPDLAQALDGAVSAARGGRCCPQKVFLR